MSLKIKEMKNKVKLIMIAITVAAFALPVMAQLKQNDPQGSSLTAPTMAFQSTSTMQPSGSTYSSVPHWNTDGTASFGDSSGTPTQIHGQPRKINPTTPDDDENPIGDGLWAMAILAAGYAAIVAYRRRKGVNADAVVKG